MGKTIKKILKGIVVLSATCVIGYFISFLLSFGDGNPETGVSFSQFYAEEKLKLDWKTAYEAILSDLHPDHLLLIAYWQYIEPEEGKYHFEDLDWEMRLADERGADVILAIGERVPRWPECHMPVWVGGVGREEQEEKLLIYLTTMVNHYKTSPSLKYWQVENEPYLSSFGMCPHLNRDFFEKEIALIKNLDPAHPIVITDSGELGLWIPAARHADILGTTLYRVVSAPVLGVFSYSFIPPAFYAAKAFLVEKFSNVSEIIITELQAEPWSSSNQDLIKDTMEVQVASFSTTTLQSNFAFAKRTGLSPIFFWGAEWWYWRKLNGDSSFWETGKQLLRVGK